jgi:hypothetical protein
MWRRRSGNFNSAIEAKKVAPAVAIISKPLITANPDNFGGILCHAFASAFDPFT